MKFTLFLLLGLIAFSFATSDEEALIKLKKIENHKLGKTILDTIALQLEAGDPVEDLIHLLQDTIQQIEDEQKIDDRFIEALQQECDEDLARLESEIESTKVRIQELKDEIAEKIPIRDEKVRIVNEKRNFKALIEQKVVELLANKELKDQEWEEEQREHDSARDIIEQAKKIIQDSLKAQSFLQTNRAQSFAQLSNHFSKHAKNQVYKAKSWNSIFSLLATITSSAPVQADQSSVQQIIEICDQLIAKIEESKEIERRDYRRWMEEFTTVMTQYEEKINELTGDIANLDAEIAALNKRITLCQNELAEQEVRLREKTAQHADKLKQCNDENLNYAKRREERDDNREVVSDAIGLLQRNLRMFRAYVKERLSTVKKAK